MDFYDLNEEREKDVMQITIDGLEIEIPEELVQEMMTVLSFDSETDLQKEILISGNALKKCFSKEELEEKGFEQRLIEYLDSEVDIYRQNKKD